MSDWTTQLLKEPFEKRREEYESESVFALILAKAETDYDRESLGNVLIEDEDWGCIDPPGPIGGFGELITQDFLEENDRKPSIQTLRDLGTEKEVAREIYPYLDAIFVADSGTSSFIEAKHSLGTLVKLLEDADGSDSVEIVEYEPG